MPSSSISSLSLETIKVQVSTEDGKDPTADTVQLSAPIKGANPTRWAAASWSTVSTPEGPEYWAAMDVGPGSAYGALSVGPHRVWAKVVDSPEVPVLRSPDILTVF